MASALDILGDLLKNGMTKSGNDRMRNVFGEKGQEGLGGFLDQIAKQIGGGSNGGSSKSSGGSNGGGNLLETLSKMAQDAIKDPKGAVKGGNPLAIGGLGALAGAILGNPSGAAKGALGAGGLALLAMLAKSALSAKQGGGQQSFTDLPLGLRGPADATEERELESRADLILKAMINAAKADGTIDQQELNHIVDRLEKTGADATARARVRDELMKPLDINDLVRAVPDEEAGVQVYAASLLATEADTDAERAYLSRLAAGLRLDQPVVAYVHREFGMA
jgi:uncharacterized membrane protein YebE (DUF533 family)